VNASRVATLVPLVTVLLLAACAADEPSVAGGELDGSPTSPAEWPHYANDAGGTKYSPLAQIDRDNVARLRVEWTARAGDFPAEMFERATHGGDSGLPDDARSVGACATCHGSEVKFETTPIMRDGTLFLSTPLNRVLALDAKVNFDDSALDRHPDFAALRDRGIVASVRDAHLRLSVHCYNHEDDIERVARALVELRRASA